MAVKILNPLDILLYWYMSHETCLDNHISKLRQNGTVLHEFGIGVDDV